MKKLNMSPHHTPGLLITFCGLDGCGKTTMLEKLAAEPGILHETVITKQPTDAVRKSDIFRTYMDCPDHSAYDYRSLSLLAASDRLQHGNKVILPELEKGKTILSDRYFYSCIANLRARGFTEDQWIYEIAESIVKPDIAFFFDVSVDTAVSRVRQRPAEKERYIDMNLQYRLREQYLEICEANGGTLISTEQSPEATYQQVLAEVLKMTEVSK
jgi:dTMP kinase